MAKKKDKSTKTLKSEVVLEHWIKHWFFCAMDSEHPLWTRKELENRIVKATKLSKEVVEERISQNFSYARKNVIKAYIKKHFDESTAPNLDESKVAAQTLLRNRLRLPNLAFAIKKGEKGKWEVGKTEGWTLPSTGGSSGKKVADWIKLFEEHAGTDDS